MNIEVKLTEIPNFSNYMADLENGRIYSVRYDKFLNPRAGRKVGYIQTTLINDDGDKVPLTVHQVMMMAHLNCDKSKWIDDGYEINHIDRNKENNEIGNLELVNRAGQYCDVTRSKMGLSNRLSADDARRIRFKKGIQEAMGIYEEDYFCEDMSFEFNVSYGTVKNVIDDNTYADDLLTVNEVVYLDMLEKFNVNMFDELFNR